VGDILALVKTPARLAVAALLLVAGCGGSHQSQAAGVDAALGQSPVSYLQYTAPIWWGTRPDVHRTALAFDGQFALAKISATEIAPPVSASSPCYSLTVIRGGASSETSSERQRHSDAQTRRSGLSNGWPADAP